jgi:hypothetical protein
VVWVDRLVLVLCAGCRKILLREMLHTSTSTVLVLYSTCLETKTIIILFFGCRAATTTS